MPAQSVKAKAVGYLGREISPSVRDLEVAGVVEADLEWDVIALTVIATLYQAQSTGVINVALPALLELGMLIRIAALNRILCLAIDR